MATSKNSKGLKLLGGPSTGFPTKPDRKILESFANRNPDRDYWIRFDCEDFTSLCPVTGQPDFARLCIRYVANKLCIETKSLKFYLASYRNERAFNEEVVNRLLNDLVAICAPRKMIVHGRFAARGGIAVSVDAAHPAGQCVNEGSTRIS